jgi:hypothetical protein
MHRGHGHHELGEPDGSQPAESSTTTLAQ